MTATFHVGDAIEVMGKLPENSVDLVLTSPPFLALRSYLPADHPDKALEGGSQSTPGEYIDWLLDVAEACDRVLAPHGSLCVELGDTYSGSGGAGGDYDQGGWREEQPEWSGSASRKNVIIKGSDPVHVAVTVPTVPKSGRPRTSDESRRGIDAKNRGNTSRGTGGASWPLAKSLSLIPETFRWAMVYGHNPFTGRQTEPWRLRNVVRWFKPNPPVGALGDKTRPGTSEFMVFCKSAKRYFDLDAVRTPADPANKRPSVLKRESIPGRTDQVMNPLGDDGQRRISNPGGAPPLDWFVEDDLEWEAREGFILPPGGYRGAHYAVFSPKAITRFIKAMCPSRVCRVCGEPSRRIVEQSPDYAAFRELRNSEYARGDNSKLGVREASGSPGTWDNKTQNINGASYSTVGWTDCGHDDWRPGLVLDCFAGSGTTGAVATGHGRDAILIDLDERNYALALERVGPFILERAS